MGLPRALDVQCLIVLSLSKLDLSILFPVAARILSTLRCIQTGSIFRGEEAHQLLQKGCQQ